MDRQIVGLIAEREKCVRDAGRLTSDPSQAAAPSRAARVVDAAVDVGLELGADPVVVRATYDAMVAAFIDQEARAIAERAQ